MDAHICSLFSSYGGTVCCCRAHSQCSETTVFFVAMAGWASAVSAGSQETPSKVMKRKRKTPQELEEEECRNWRRRANAKGRTLNMSPECIRKSSNASRHPPVSGRRGGRPFLFQSLRGRQILQDSVDSDASSDNECLKTRHLRHKITQRHNESEDSMTFFG